MGTVEQRLDELGLELPAAFAPPASTAAPRAGHTTRKEAALAPPGAEFKFELVRISGPHAYVSGHGPFDGDRCLVAGKVGDGVSLEQGAEAARLTGLSILASLKQELGDLDRVTGWVKALGLVNCAPGFNKTPAVINGFSELIIELWGEAGRHARSAIGAAELPFDMAVEVEAVVEVSG